MFWGLTLDSRKRYSQVTDDSYYVTMAALEPLKNGKESSDKYVSLNLENKNGEFLLCTLQHGKVMQVPLNIMINKGESTCFFLNGEGTVHLTGYCLEEDDDDDEEEEELVDTSTEISADSSRLCSQIGNKKCPKTDESITDGDMYSESEDDESESEADSDSATADDDDDMEDASIDKTVEKTIKNSPTKSANMKDKKRKVDFEKGNMSKKLKGGTDTPQNSSPQRTLDFMTKKKQQMQSSCESIKEEEKLKEIKDKDSDQDNEEFEESEYDNEEEGSEDNSTDDEANSSIGRTPMPNKDKRSCVIKNDHVDLDSSYIKGLPNNSTKKSKNKFAKEEDRKDFSLSILTSVSNNNEAPTSSTPKNATMTKKNVGGVQIEDLRMGSGPPARNGRMVSIHYTGKLTNGKVFDSNEPPKKPFSFRLGKSEVIKGFDTGILGMKVGGKRKLTIPPNLAFGNEKNSGIPPNSTLIFVLELKAVN